MSYQILPNLLIVLAFFGIALMFLRRLPEAVELKDGGEKKPGIGEFARRNGLPEIRLSGMRARFKFWLGKVWRFVLEAKGLRPGHLAGFKLKKLFVYSGKKGQAPGVSRQESSAATGQGEEELLADIKREPKNLENYRKLGQLYLSEKRFSESAEVFGYMAAHEPADAFALSRMAFCQFQMKDFALAAENYQKSLKLDSAQPSRYYNLGLCLKNLGKTQEAKEAFLKANEIEPENQKYKNALDSV